MLCEYAPLPFKRSHCARAFSHFQLAITLRGLDPNPRQHQSGFGDSAQAVQRGSLQSLLVQVSQRSDVIRIVLEATSDLVAAHAYLPGVRGIVGMPAIGSDVGRGAIGTPWHARFASDANDRQGLHLSEAACRRRQRLLQTLHLLLVDPDVDAARHLDEARC